MTGFALCTQHGCAIGGVVSPVVMVLCCGLSSWQCWLVGLLSGFGLSSLGLVFVLGCRSFCRVS